MRYETLVSSLFYCLISFSAHILPDGIPVTRYLHECSLGLNTYNSKIHKSKKCKEYQASHSNTKTIKQYYFLLQQYYYYPHCLLLELFSCLAVLVPVPWHAMAINGLVVFWNFFMPWLCLWIISNDEIKYECGIFMSRPYWVGPDARGSKREYFF